jgi:hypothetical protein
VDTDLDRLSREQLIEEVKRLRQGIRKHRDSTQHELCWHHPALWGLLPEKTDPLPAVPDWPQFMQGCGALSAVAGRAGAERAATTETYQP